MTLPEAASERLSRYGSCVQERGAPRLNHSVNSRGRRVDGKPFGFYVRLAEAQWRLRRVTELHGIAARQSHIRIVVTETDRLVSELLEASQPLIDVNKRRSDEVIELSAGWRAFVAILGAGRPSLGR